MISLLYATSFIAIFFTIIFIFRPNKEGITKLVNSYKKKTTKKVPLRVKIIESTTKNKFKKTPLTYASEVSSMLKLMGKENQFRFFLLFSICFSFASCVVAAAMSNLFIAPAGIFLGFSLPVIYVTLSFNKFLKQLDSALESSLSIITASYLRSEDIISAIQENITYISEPIRSALNHFLFLSKKVNPDIIANLKSVKNLIHNEIWEEWIDGVISSYDDRTLKNILIPIIDKLSRKQQLTRDLEQEAYKPLKEFIVVGLIAALNPFIIKMLNKEWYEIITTNLVGKISIAVMLVFIVLGIFKAISLTKVVNMGQNSLERSLKKNERNKI
jgi:uncharacterized membrane protein YuzA (DUF378 family)